ncbi:M15 family metallopeptidase [Paenibacillus sp. P32E]|uniref:M15 family metallopeptidase n=1 Tax=Paenibacillus sp. P32E TaxID=1349434 RepID=UPI00273D66BE|nr:M15 family metallopeptidase [Paenibacillus sp. P32E]
MTATAIKVSDWQEVVKEAKALGFEWGGDFKSIKDAPHFQMTFGLSTSALRQGYSLKESAVKAAYAVIDKLKEDEVVKKDVKVTVKVDGKKIEDSVLDEGVAYLPVRAVAEALGLTVGWDQVSKTVTLSKGAK